MSWNDRLIRALELIIEQRGYGPAGGSMDWNAHVIRLLEQIRDTDGSGSGGGVQEHAFGTTVPVPSEGTLWMSVAGVPTSAAPLVIGTACVTRVATVSISEVDSNDYDVLLYADGALIETIPIPAGDKTVEVTLSGASLAVGTKVTALLNRATGSGSSSFHVAVLVLELAES
jgi:hypothetical protein